MCKHLGVPPRGGGILDQPAHEIVLLNTVFEAIEKDEQRQRERDAHRNKAKAKGKPQKVPGT